jgi:chemotaxis protein CheZ
MGAKRPSPFNDLDYDAIEAAVMETSRGRWFMGEFARRNRAADTDILLEAIKQLETTIGRHQVIPNHDRIRRNVAEVVAVIDRAKQEIATPRTDPSKQLDAISFHTHRTNQSILSSVEKIQQSTWALRQRGADQDLCEALDAYSTEIYGACSHQDLTGQRIAQVIGVLRYVADRLRALAALVDQSAGGPDTVSPSTLDAAEAASPGQRTRGPISVKPISR